MKHPTETYMKAQTTSGASAGFPPVRPCLSHAGRPKAGHSTPEVVPQVMSWGDESFPPAHYTPANIDQAGFGFPGHRDALMTNFLSTTI